MFTFNHVTYLPALRFNNVKDLKDNLRVSCTSDHNPRHVLLLRSRLVAALHLCNLAIHSSSYL